MVTAREKFVWKKLREKYGLVGEVAGRYVAAGYGVKLGIKSGETLFDIVAQRKNEKLAIKIVYEKKPITYSDLEKIEKDAKAINAKPVLVLYGKGPWIPREELEKLDDSELTITITRITATRR